jgi:aspartyl-tRNA synthetase
MADWQRTHTCGELRETHLGQRVVLNGWVNTLRSYPLQVFIDLRDRYGITQIVVDRDNPAAEPGLYALADRLGREFCLSVHGRVVARQPGKDNPNIATGKVEVHATKIIVLNECPTPPFEVTEFPGEELANEDIRLQYRYLDLRRPSLQRIFALRHRMNKTIRDYLDRHGFYELETPLLGRSTPEGARDYLVPSRIHPGQWYALPQSPQIYKQLLMVAGYDKYFQIARCLRDEDLRADRQPEFTQLDLEMSFVEQDDVLNLIEGLTAEVFGQCIGYEVKLPLRRMSYAEAMLRYGTDKPDLRYGMEIIDISPLAARSDFGVFRSTVEAGHVVRGLCVSGGAAHFSNTDLKPKGKLEQYVQQLGAKGLAWFKVTEAGLESSIAKFFAPPLQSELIQLMQAKPGDLLLFVADQPGVVADVLGALRTHLAATLHLIDPKAQRFEILWVVDFPSFFYDEEEGRWVANHHPFTAPRDEDLPYLETNPGQVYAKAYDLVINGYECGGGSIRIHRPDVQARVFACLGMTEEQARSRFGFLLDALKSGAPPHGGIALGLDRWVMMLAGTTNIRDVILFPKNQKARDLMTGAPAEVDRKQLKELGL